MEKRGQVTVFIILGIVVIAITMLIVYLNSSLQESQIEPEIKRSSSFDTTPIEQYIGDCAKETLIKAVSLRGLNETKISSYINANLENCTDFSIFEGITVSTEPISSEVVLTENNNTVLASIIFPVTLKKDQNIKTITEIHASYDLTVQINISTNNTNNSGILSDDVICYANNDDLNFTIPAGTTITNANGMPVDKLEVQIIHISSENVGVVDYDFRPNNVYFSPYAILELKYRDEDNNGIVDDTDIDEKDMQIRYFDEPTSSWISLPTEVDSAGNKIKAKIKHFTKYGMGVPHKLNLNVTNPIALERTGEPIRFTFSLNDSLLHRNNADFVTVHENSNRKEILSDHTTFDLVRYPSGYVKSMTVVFMDDYNKSETKHYKISLNDISNFTVPDINVSFKANPGFQHSYKQNDGYKNTYTFDTSAIEIRTGKYSYILFYSGRGAEITGLKYIPSNRSNDSAAKVEAETLNYGIDLIGPVYENVLTSPSDDLEEYWEKLKEYLKDPFNFEVWGEDWWVDKEVTYVFEKPSIAYENNKILSVIRIYFTKPRILPWGPDAENHDGVTAYAEVTFYRNSSRVDVYNSYRSTQKFYNHAGFDIGGTGIGGGSGSSLHFTFGDKWRNTGVVQWFLAYKPEETTSLLLKTGDSEGKGIDSKEYIPNSSLKKYYALDRGNGKVIFAYLPIFESQFGRYKDEHDDHYPSSGYFIFPSGIGHTIVQTGLGVGWIPYPVPPRMYSNVANYNTDMNYSTDLSVYDKQARIFGNPVGINGHFPAYKKVYAKS